MYFYNCMAEHWEIKDYAPGKQADKNKDDWGGGQTRRLLWAAYSVAFLCLLWFDEVLNIQVHDIKFIEGKHLSMKLTVPFRKTHQCGGQLSSMIFFFHHLTWNIGLIEIPPFHLFAMPPEQQHLCAVRAVAEWLKVTNLQTGYLFCQITSGDRIDEANTPMVGFWCLNKTPQVNPIFRQVSSF